jgi:hypothetical protein
MANAQAYTDQWAKQVSDFKGGKPVNVDIKSAVSKDPYLQKLIPQLGRYAGMAPDQAIEQMRKDNVDPALIGKFSNMFGGIDAVGMNQKRIDDLKNSEKGADALAAQPALVASFPKDIKTYNPSLTTGQVSSLTRQLGPNPTQKDYKDALEQAGKLADRNIAKDAARTKLDDTGQKQLFDYGVSGDTRLNLDNAPDNMLVNSKNGTPIPYKQTASLKPTMQESNRKDFATSAIHSLDALNNLIATNEAKFGPISGPVDKWMAGHGLGDQYQQAALNYLTFAQSAATGAHVGGRFNVPIMEKMGTTINVNMNRDQLKGAMDSIKDVMQQYVDQGGRVTVGEYRDMSPAARKKLAGGEFQAPTYRRDPVTKAVQQSTDGGKSWQ